MLNPDQIIKEAQRLNQAEKNRQQVKASTTLYPSMEIRDAYNIQEAWMNIKLAEGRTVAGHKIGLTSRTMQKAMSIDEPDFGVLLDDMVYAESSTIEVARFLDPRIEVELAFFLKEPLEGKNIGLLDVLNATDYVMPALEIIAARSFRLDPDTGYKRTVKDTIADNAANAGVILGGLPVRADEIDLRWVACLLSKNGVIEESGVSAAVLNHPAKGIAWLANKYTEYDRVLGPGQIILAGSFTRPISIEAGDTITADYGPLGTISCHFT